MNTENMEMREPEINLFDLVVEILLHWRMVVFAMLVGGLLLGGFSYWKSLQRQNLIAEEQKNILAMTEDEKAEQWKTGQLALEEQLDEGQLYNVQNALLCRKLIDEKIAYQQNSHLQQMDPFHVQRTELLFVVRMEDMGQAETVKSVYENLLTGTELFEYIEEQCNLKDNVEELVSEYTVMQDDTNLQAVHLQINDTSAAINIRILHEDADVCQAMADAVLSYLDLKQKELQDVMGSHEVELISRSQREVVDHDTAALQKNIANDISLLRYIYNLLKKDFSDEELQYYNYMLTENPLENLGADLQDTEDEVGVLLETTEVSAGISIKYVFLGMGLFAFIYVFAFILLYITNNKLRCIDNLQDIYGMSQLGVISSLPSKRFLGVIDKWILKLRYHNRRRFSPEDSIELTAVAVKMAAKKQNLNQVYLVGCNLAGKTEEVCEKIKTFLEKEQINAQILNNVLYDAESMEQLGNVKAVVLVETAKSTLYKEIEAELQMLCRQNVKVLGGIVVE